MVITLSNLPPHISEDDIRNLLNGDSRVQNIRLSNAGNPDKVMAFVEMDISRLEAQFLSRKLHQTYVENRRIEAYTPLFFQR